MSWWLDGVLLAVAAGAAVFAAVQATGHSPVACRAVLAAAGVMFPYAVAVTRLAGAQHRRARRAVDLATAGVLLAIMAEVLL